MKLMMIEIGSPLAAAFGALAALATALGVQKWLPDLIKAKTKDDKCRRHIEKLVASMTILLTILEEEAGNSPGVKAGIKEAQDMLGDIKREYSQKQ